jgi:hypothetical protein
MVQQRAIINSILRNETVKSFEIIVLNLMNYAKTFG